MSRWWRRTPSNPAGAPVEVPNQPADLGFCRYCGRPLINGYLVTTKGLFSRKTGRPVEVRVYGALCPAIASKYIYDVQDSHDGYELRYRTAREVEL